MLPQGQFQKLLTERGEEQSKTFRKLFGTEIYEIITDKIFEYNYYPSLNLSNGGSYENLGLLNIQRNSMAVTSRNFSNYGNMGYPNLNMSRNESGQSFNSSMNRQNN